MDSKGFLYAIRDGHLWYSICEKVIEITLPISYSPLSALIHIPLCALLC